MMGAKMKDWNREEQQTKSKDKKLTNITDHELEMNNADVYEDSDEGDNEDSESNSEQDYTCTFGQDNIDNFIR